ncbi:Aldo-ket-red domain-containing protein [Mycena venus]|uniref:Aldo-ket-red domain-containing protein n=1 Tax=Mycena venus TaxID=2733690 RepID=A0A8H6X5K5_9AGAR|nr:Aldo-ket-red domain-containing protein [Mycena venus]
MDPSHETFQLGPFTAPRLWTGLWQLSSNAWGTASVSKVRQAMGRHVQRGYTAFGENMVRFSFTYRRQVRSSRMKNSIIGVLHRVCGPCFIRHAKGCTHHLPPSRPLRQRRNNICTGKASPWMSDSSSIVVSRVNFAPRWNAPETVIGATKYCVFKPIVVSRETVEAAVHQRMERMRTKRVDLLQFHWQDYELKSDYMQAVDILNQLKSEGLIAALGLCNFDTLRTDEICTQFPGAIVSNQVQFSLIDTRPLSLNGLADVCTKHGVKLLTYGTLCGGFLSDKWIDEPEPDPYSGSLNPSQRKYLDMIIKAWGTWALFQDLLRVLRDIGGRHGGLSVSNVATRWVLDHQVVGAVIIGKSHPFYNEHHLQPTYQWQVRGWAARSIRTTMPKSSVFL